MIAGIHSAPTGQKRGVLVSTPYEGGPVVQTDIVQCCHCSRVWVWVPGSGRRRGFCMRCNGITCGSHTCDACVPFEQQLDNMECGRPVDFRPIVASVTAAPPKG